MRKVFQDKFDFGKGNCVWACIASLFDLELSDLDYAPPTSQDLIDWTKREMSDLEFHNVDYGYNYRVVDGYEDCEHVGTGRWTYDLRPDEEKIKPTTEFWLASVHSLQLKRPICDSYYPMPALHMVVMQGDKLWHDPNPKNPRDYEPTVVMASWWEPNEAPTQDQSA